MFPEMRRDPGYMTGTIAERTWWLRWMHGDQRTAYNPDGRTNGHPTLEMPEAGPVTAWFRCAPGVGPGMPEHEYRFDRCIHCGARRGADG